MIWLHLITCFAIFVQSEQRHLYDSRQVPALEILKNVLRGVEEVKTLSTIMGAALERVQNKRAVQIIPTVRPMSTAASTTERRPMSTAALTTERRPMSTAASTTERRPMSTAASTTERPMGAEGPTSTWEPISTTPDTSKITSTVPDEEIAIFLAHLSRLTHVANQTDLFLRPLCVLMFDSIEFALMKSLARNPGTAMKQTWPAECAQIESILTVVKKEMETVEEKFKEATLIARNAVYELEQLKALQSYWLIQSNIQPVFDKSLENIKQAEAILKTLKPKIEKVFQKSMDRAIAVTLSVVVVAACLAAYWFSERRTLVAVITLLIVIWSFGFSILQRSELRNDLDYYNAEISLIMKIDLHKSQLDGQQKFLEKLFNDK